MAKSKKAKTPSSMIAQNKRARHEFFIEETFEAGLSLLGWEVKAMRAGKANISDSYVHLKDGECFLIGCHVTPLISTSTHVRAEPLRYKKLLMHRGEINKLIGYVERKGYSLVALKLYWSQGKVKCQIGLAKGKKEHDKRAAIKERDWQRNKARILRNG